MLRILSIFHVEFIFQCSNLKKLHLCISSQENLLLWRRHCYEISSVFFFALPASMFSGRAINGAHEVDSE